MQHRLQEIFDAQIGLIEQVVAEALFPLVTLLEVNAGHRQLRLDYWAAGRKCGITRSANSRRGSQAAANENGGVRFLLDGTPCVLMTTRSSGGYPAGGAPTSRRSTDQV
jgi:YD repeat-containing protein